GGYYDFFRNRLMFPIFNRIGKVISFSGRDLSNADGVAKYQNGSETSIYSKKIDVCGIIRRKCIYFASWRFYCEESFLLWRGYFCRQAI
ncbi:hypothetical protein EOM81_12475, partial [bacterium]|nr:hypothetical protein [bacterium]